MIDEGWEKDREFLEKLRWMSNGRTRASYDKDTRYLKIEDFGSYYIDSDGDYIFGKSPQGRFGIKAKDVETIIQNHKEVPAIGSMLTKTGYSGI